MVAESADGGGIGRGELLGTEGDDVAIMISDVLPNVFTRPVCTPFTASTTSSLRR